MSLRRNPACQEARDRLAAALIQLTKEKALDQVSITELCNLAKVSRMSFYRNFDSKSDVLVERLKDLIEDYRTATASLLAAGESWHDRGHLAACFHYFQCHSEFVDTLLRCGLSGTLVEEIAKFIIDTWSDGSPESRIVLTGFAGSLCACYIPWSKGGFKESPQYMAQLVSDNFAPHHEPSFKVN